MSKLKSNNPQCVFTECKPPKFPEILNMNPQQVRVVLLTCSLQMSFYYGMVTVTWIPAVSMRLCTRLSIWKVLGESRSNVSQRVVNWLSALSGKSSSHDSASLWFVWRLTSIDIWCQTGVDLLRVWTISWILKLLPYWWYSEIKRLLLQDWDRTCGKEAKGFRFLIKFRSLTSLNFSLLLLLMHILLFCDELLCSSLGTNWLFSPEPRQPIVSCSALIRWNVILTDASGDNFLNGTVNTKYLLSLNSHRRDLI